jgi:hypothetical protein
MPLVSLFLSLLLNLDPDQPEPLSRKSLRLLLRPSRPLPPLHGLRRRLRARSLDRPRPANRSADQPSKPKERSEATRSP